MQASPASRARSFDALKKGWRCIKGGTGAIPRQHASMRAIPEPWWSIAQGAGIGAALGGGAAAASYFMKQRKPPPIDVPGPTQSLRHDPELLRLVSGFTPLRGLSAETRRLYDTMVASCNHVLRAEQKRAVGADQYMASRAALQASSSAKALCTEAAKLTRRGAKCAVDPFEAMRDVETLDALVNNHLHNVMLQA